LLHFLFTNDFDRNLIQHYFFSGSYDNTLKVWDLRNSSQVLTFNLTFQVESVIALPGGTAVVAAGSRSLQMFDLASGSSTPVLSANPHSKEITAVSNFFF
jgi:WD40 repeat protein